jgi:hypothetical protein
MIDPDAKREITRDIVDMILETSSTEGVVDANEALFLTQTVQVIIIRSLSECGAFDCVNDISERVIH